MTHRKIIGKCLLQKLLNDRRMTQTELADKTGIDHRQINSYIKSKRIMSLGNAKLIAFALKCSIDDLYEWNIE